MSNKNKYYNLLADLVNYHIDGDKALECSPEHRKDVHELYHRVIKKFNKEEDK